MSTLFTLTNLSILVIAFQVFVIMLVPAVLFYFLIRGVGWLQINIRLYGPQARGAFRQVAQVTEDASHKAALPVIAVSTTTARAGRVWSAATSLFVRKEVPR